ncbi:c-type cytochrome biogenesis protein CcmI [Thalassotalea sp. G2M2-11]|uniref:c-type cytochrome biogenesis protein CcmI n=1 Tax=Thalassotalea sp. G2M2-11 TaxID=2787627 RepID=UPI0019D207CF|nr:c-type cytochrome biogenesis protein CcmI [Thalassotalea sp. G2M2-11]
MTNFWILAPLLIVGAFSIVFYGYFIGAKGIKNVKQDVRQDTNIELYHEHLQELEKDLNGGEIDQQTFVELKTELDKTLLHDVNTSEPQKHSGQVGYLSVLWPVSISMFIGAASFYFYLQLGAYDLLQQPAVVSAEDPHANLDMNQMALLKVQQLQQKVANEPTNSQAWFSLGHAFIGIGQYDNAVDAFDQVMTLVGEHAELIGPKAQALYYKNGEHINEQVQALIDKALSLDPIDASTNILLGMNSYAQNKFSLAISYWEKVLNSGRPGINTRALVGAITEAKNQLSTRGEILGDVDTNQAKQDVNQPRLTIDLSFSPDILARLQQGEDKIVFVYAVPTTADSRMPLAAVKVYASDLPTTIVLDNSLAMSATMNLNSVDKVNLYALVSMQGVPSINPGDFISERLAVDVNHKDIISMSVDHIVPN